MFRGVQILSSNISGTAQPQLLFKKEMHGPLTGFHLAKLDKGASLGNANPSNKKGTWRMPSARAEEAEKV